MPRHRRYFTDYADKATDDLTAQQRREIADGRAFIILRENNTPLSLIAGLAGIPEKEVKRLMEVARKAGK